ncbi:hypothetical protein G5I_00151 [Acromyrmex echinatior]|uniref:Uncharacterized protein n=1 Tax=Acromyrmex echinatior TaxID=103372 RepID=F4W446_ACREC|nr:hypothetical protein G5I_00151 [Acromyrmex echinatior]
MAVRFCGCKGALDIRRQDLVRIITTSGSRRQRSSPRSSGTATRLDLVDRVQLLYQADSGEPLISNCMDQNHRHPAGRRRFFSLSPDATVSITRSSNRANYPDEHLSMGQSIVLRGSDSGIVQPHLGDGSSLQRIANRPMANVSLCDWRDRITEEDEDS